MGGANKSGCPTVRSQNILKKAVLISEDAGFYSHKGVDMTELKAAFKKDLEDLEL